MLEVYRFFSENKTNGYTLAQFRTEWAKLTPTDKEHLKEGIENGTFDYKM
jgi:hypothetical protein